MKAKAKKSARRVRSFLVFASFKQHTKDHVQVSFDPPLYVRAVPLTIDFSKAFTDKVIDRYRCGGSVRRGGDNLMNGIPATPKDCT